MLRAMQEGGEGAAAADRAEGGGSWKGAGNSRRCVECGTIVTYKLTFKMFGFGFGF